MIDHLHQRCEAAIIVDVAFLFGDHAAKKCGEAKDASPLAHHTPGTVIDLNIEAAQIAPLVIIKLGSRRPDSIS